MNTCRHIQNQIYPYLDGELSALERRKMEEHLLACQRCGDILHKQKRFLALLDNRALLEEGPAELKDRIIRQLKPKKNLPLRISDFFTCRRTAALAIAATLVVLIFVAITPQRNAIQPFIRSTVADHQGLLHGALKLELVDDDPQVAAHWLMEQIGMAPTFPVFDDQDIILVGARVSRYKGRHIGIISYRVNKEPVTLAIAPKSPETDIETGDYSYVGKRRINFTSFGGFHIVSWSVCANNYALVSALPQKGKQSCSVCHGKGSGLMDLSAFYSNI